MRNVFWWIAGLTAVFLSRKSLGAVEPSVRLTERERLAREEQEEINVALMEIQLRDEKSFPALGVSPSPLQLDSLIYHENPAS